MRLKTKLFASQLDAAVAILEVEPQHRELAAGLRESVELYKGASARKRKWCRAWYAANMDKASAYRKDYYANQPKTSKRRRDPVTNPELSPAERLDAMVARLREPLTSKPAVV